MKSNFNFIPMKTQLNIVFLFIIGLFIQSGHAQNVTVAGSDIRLSDGSSITIPGDLTFIADVEIENAGIISVGGNLKNNANGDLYLENGSGSVVLNGTSGQIIGGNFRTYFGNLSVNQYVDLENEIHVSGIMQLNNAKISLNKYNLFIEPNAQITGANENAYLIAQSQGVLVQEVGNDEVLFPVGTSTSYLPATLLNTGLTDNYAIGVFADILDFGTSGVTIPEIDHCVFNTWNIIEQNPGGSNLSINLQWNTENEMPSFDRTKSGIGYFHDGVWNGQEAGQAAGSNPYSLTRNDLTDVGAFAVGDENSPMAIAMLYELQNIFLAEGWSGISSYLAPANPNLEGILASVVNEMIIMQNFNGFYWPGQGLNTLGNWNSHAGYQIKMETAQRLIFTGTPQDDLSIHLNTGWNYLPVLVPFIVAVDELFLLLSDKLVIVKDIAGLGIYWPAMNINTLGYLEPGKAYFVLVTENGEVDYTGFKSTFTGSKNLSASPDLTAFNIQATPISHTIAILPSAIEAFDPGTLIGAYDQAGNCFGITKICEGNNSITIFGDDPTTGEKDGFVEGEMMFFQTLSGLPTLTGLNATFDISLPQSDGHFTENGLSAIKQFKSATGVGFHDLGRLVNIFPNPSDGVVNITGLKSGAKITVSDVQGQIVRVVEIVTAVQTSLDMIGHNAGVYFIKITTTDKTEIRKIIIR